MSMDSKKSNKIKEIVRLQQLLNKWRKFAKTSKSSRGGGGGGGGGGMKFLKKTLSLTDNSSPRSPRETSNNVVPKGYIAVCVGEELKRSVIPIEYLGHHAFRVLLREAEEEFGFQQTGVLRFPCQVSIFENILKMVEQKQEVFLIQECRLSREKIMGCFSSENPLVISNLPQRPMCR